MDPGKMDLTRDAYTADATVGGGGRGPGAEGIPKTSPYRLRSWRYVTMPEGQVRQRKITASGDSGKQQKLHEISQRD